MRGAGYSLSMGKNAWGKFAMTIRTVMIGSCVSVQGVFVRQLGNGNIVVRVGDKTYTGRPVKDVAGRAA